MIYPSDKLLLCPAFPPKVAVICDAPGLEMSSDRIFSCTGRVRYKHAYLSGYLEITGIPVVLLIPQREIPHLKTHLGCF